MEEVNLKVYKENRTFFGKIRNSINKLISKSGNSKINSSSINKKRNLAVHKYDNYLKKKKNLEEFEDAYQEYLEEIEDYIINKVYNRVKDRVSTDYEGELLSKYYVILQLKDKEYYEYKYKKEIYLLTEDYKSVENYKNTSREYKKMFREKLEKTYKNLFKNYNEEWHKNKEEQYIIKILNSLEEFCNNCYKHKKEDNLEKYMELLEKDPKDIINYINKQNMQIKLLKTYFEEEVSKEIVEKLYNELVFNTNKWLNDNTDNKEFSKVFNLLIKIIEENNETITNALGLEIQLIAKDEYTKLKNKLLKLKVLKRTIKLKRTNTNKYKAIKGVIKHECK